MSRTCRSCDRPLGKNDRLRHDDETCRAFLTRFVPTQGDVATAPPCRWLDCSGTVRSNTCSHCGLPRFLFLEFQWGSGARVPSGRTIPLGRHENTVPELAEFPNVSATHCVVDFTRYPARVTDVGSDGRGSRNGTYLDGLRLTPNDWKELVEGAMLELGRDSAAKKTSAVRVRVSYRA